GVAFERYVDDAVVHCVSEAQAIEVAKAISGRMEQVGLRLHPDKTRIVYCKDGKRRGSYEHTSFTFLGFEFRQRRARDKHSRHGSFTARTGRGVVRTSTPLSRSWGLSSGSAGRGTSTGGSSARS